MAWEVQRLVHRETIAQRLPTLICQRCCSGKRVEFREICFKVGILPIIISKEMVQDPLIAINRSSSGLKTEICQNVQATIF